MPGNGIDQGIKCERVVACTVLEIGVPRAYEERGLHSWVSSGSLYIIEV